MQKILEDFILKSLAAQNQRRTAKSLGNRALYIGASDIAASFGCERRVVLNKTLPEDEAEEISIKSLLSLERGHWVEAGIGKALASKASHFLSGVSIDFTTEAGTPVQIHPDFIVLGKDQIVVFEVKSVKDIGKTSRVEHQAQTQCQVSALKKLWATPAFSMGDHIKKATFPMLVSMALGKAYTETPPEIIGVVLSVAPDDLSVSPPIIPNNAFWDVLQKKADDLWKKVQSPEIELRAARGIYLLCDFCRHIADCPNFASTNTVVGVKERVMALKEIKAAQKELDAEEEALKEELKSFASAGGLMGLWLEEDGFKAKVAMQPGRKSFDEELLRQKLEQEHGLSQEVIDKLFGECTSFGTPFMRVNTHEAKEPSEKKAKGKKAQASDSKAVSVSDPQLMSSEQAA